MHLNATANILPFNMEVLSALLAKSRTPGVIKGFCRMYSMQAEVAGLSRDEEKIRTKFQREFRKGVRLFAMREPYTGMLEGKYFCTYFQHPMLTNLLQSALGDRDIDISAEIVRTEMGFAVKLIGLDIKELDGKPLDIPFSADAGRPVMGQRPGDESFARRAIESLYAVDQAEFVGVDTWADLPGVSLHEGVIMLASNRSTTMLIDLKRFPHATGQGLHREPEVSGVAWIGQKSQSREVMDFLTDDGAILKYAKNALRECKVEPPAKMSCHLFAWQRYVTDKQ